MCSIEIYLQLGSSIRRKWFIFHLLWYIHREWTAEIDIDKNRKQLEYRVEGNQKIIEVFGIRLLLWSFFEVDH